MKAVLKYDLKPYSVELREVPEPEIGPHEVLLETKAAGVCGSDVEMWHNTQSWRVNVPVIQGHEFCGVVAEVGREVTAFKVGDPVVSETAAYICGKCFYCRTGEYNLCPDRLGFGYGTHGAFARYVRVPERCLHRIPEGVSFEEAALTEPLSVAYNALGVKSRIRPGSSVVIVGPGTIGLMCLQVAKASGASRIIVCGTSADKKRLEIAESLGANGVVMVDKEDPITVVNRYTDGLGADLVVDTAGHSEALKTALAVVRRAGQITKIGWGPEPLGFSLDPLVAKAVTLQGSFSHNWPVWESALELMRSKLVNVKALITHQLRITEWEKAFTLIQNREALKVLLYPE